MVKKAILNFKLSVRPKPIEFYSLSAYTKWSESCETKTITF